MADFIAGLGLLRTQIVGAGLPCCVKLLSMALTFDSLLDEIMHLTKPDKARLLASVAMDVAGAHPGIDFQPNVCSGVARIVRTRIPIWTLEVMRRDGMSDAQLLAAYPTLTAEDLANAWSYARTHRDELTAEIAANSDDS